MVPPQRIYISDRREGTAPTIVLHTFDSPNLSPPALSGLSLEVLTETLADMYKKCFNFCSETTENEFCQHHLLSSTIKHAGFKELQVLEY